MRLVHALFNDALPLMIIIMDSALGTGDKSVSEQCDLKPQRSHLGREDRGPMVRKWPGGLSSSVPQATSQRHLCGGGGVSDAGIRSCSRSHLGPPPEWSLRQRLMTALLSISVNPLTWPLQSRCCRVAGMHTLGTVLPWLHLPPLSEGPQGLVLASFPSCVYFPGSPPPPSRITFPNEPSTHKPWLDPGHGH